MDGERLPDSVPIHNFGPVTRAEYDDLRRDLESFERRWVDQCKQIRKLREQYHALRRWQSWILGATAVGAYVLGHATDWLFKK